MPFHALLQRLSKLFYSQVARLSWGMLLGLMVLHGFITYAGLARYETGEILQRVDFFYFYTTTVFTIGYGDIAPKTPGGRLFAALWLQPGGVVLFAAGITKFVQTLSNLWRQRMRGEASYEDLAGHIVILGWSGDLTRRMVDEIRADQHRVHREIVLCAHQEMENPLPDLVKFVRGTSLAEEGLHQRAGVAKAHTIIVFGEDDGETLTAGLAAAALNHSAHHVAYFRDKASAKLYKAHCKKSEAVVSVGVEMVVRAAQDPGSSRVIHDLLSSVEGQFEVSIQVPAHAKPMRYDDLLIALKRDHAVTLIGVASNAYEAQIHLNADGNHMVQPSEVLYLIAPRRIDAADIKWPGSS